ncbi:NitT/TauT family transport system ATP-binding protein [Oikeobacillus pervagus]|uniref:Carnitine transport ATP-binding protein OpuCA n=1 Tax=Oikeobacillus pervagus TaxID=1325931 RepID=A0AAJ1T137_9BACI|nr:ABC transporter ATP-binding protein [Oikeobacillus pervagus]MDQ0214867.1 NitT/TauT family transport system ATP-binding protein [Oikeobacillus pervagus]
MFLQFKNLSKKYKNRHMTQDVLMDINFSIEEGQFVSIIGPSGCGKSTLLSMVAGLTNATTGEIFLEASPIIKPGIDRGMVFQQAALFPWMTVVENVMFPLRKQMNKSEAKKVALRFLQMVQLSNYSEHSPHELSGGMQQRVAIARALAMDPKLLLMDEPFGALDEQTRSRLHEELEKIWVDTKKTIVFVTHSINEAIKLSDRIIVMGTRPGRIIADLDVNLPRPRQSNQEEVAILEEKIVDLLKGEIDKVVKEELAYAAGN